MLTATLRRVAPVTPGVLRLTFHAPGLPCTGHADEWVHVFLGEPGDHRDRRNLTIRARRPDADEVDLDVVLHDHGLMSDWARRARPGWRLPWGDVSGSYAPPSDTVWQLLACDVTGLPALERIVAELPADARAFAVVETYDPADRRELPSAARLDVAWIHGSGGGHRPSRLADAVDAFPEPPGIGYRWVTGETRTVRAVRRRLRHERGLPRERYSLTGYWLERAEEWQARFERVADDLSEIWTRGAAEGRDEADVLDEYEDALDRAGL
ncbi:MAG: siderophore-interacting protein [Solirubrobacteraceae bacterium]|nr:siderophore-interacting protein [Solirubrobacteraceae bacterium]